MSDENIQKYRILIIDDNVDIHEDFKKILSSRCGSYLKFNQESEFELEALEEELFKIKKKEDNLPVFELDFAQQGQEGLEKVVDSLENDQPFSLVFCDIRMPPGWDGVTTVKHLWEKDENLEVIFCSAYSDFSLQEMYNTIDQKNEFLIINKPFDTIEIRQAALALCKKWTIKKQLDEKVSRAQTQLLLADKMASIGQLALGMVHEIKTPISYMSTSIAQLQRHFDQVINLVDVYLACESHIPQDTPMLQELHTKKSKLDLDFLRTDISNLVNESYEEISRVKSLIQNLRDFASQDGQEIGEYNVLSGFETILNIARKELNYKAVVKTDFEQLPEIQAVGSQINQVILNLLLNACHAVHQDGEIKLSAGKQKDKIWFSVEDNGEGMSHDTLKQIFKPFFTTKPSEKGTGLGLSLSYGIVKAHHGHIDVKSESHKGTKFTVTLPICQKDRALLPFNLGLQ